MSLSTQRPRDKGFTLTEVLIVMVIIGVLAVAIGAVFSVIVRSSPPTEARADDARSLLGISTWLPADVSSTPRSQVSAPPEDQDVSEPDSFGFVNWDRRSSADSGCANGNDGQNLLKLRWRESLGGSPVNYFASYRLVEGLDSSRIARVTCTNGGSASVLNVTAGLPLAAANPVTVTWKYEAARATEAPAEFVIIGVEFEITTFEGDTLRVDASTVNPSATLSTLPDATTEGPTNSPPIAYNLWAEVTQPTPLGTDPETFIVEPITVEIPASDPDGDALALTFPPDVGSIPTGWMISIVSEPIGWPPAGWIESIGSGLFVEITPPETAVSGAYAEFVYVVADPAGETATAVIKVEVIDSSSPTTSTALPTTTTLPCEASFVGASPNPVLLQQGTGATTGALRENVTVTIERIGSCSELVLRYQRVVSGKSPTSPETKVFGDSLTVTLLATNTERWQRGVRPLELIERTEPGAPDTLHDTVYLEVE